MTARTAGGAVAIAVLAAIFALAPAAEARQDGLAKPRQLADVRHSPEPSFPAFFAPVIDLGTRDGYEVQVFGELGRVYVLVSNDWAATFYAAPGTVTPTRLQADLGRFGRVSVRFRPSRNRTWVKPDRSCRGVHRFANRIGVFTGTVRFRGERGYVSVRARRSKGLVTVVARQCLRRQAAPSRSRSARGARLARRDPLPGVLRARWRDGVSSARFTAKTSGSATKFSAETETSEGRVAIFSAAYREGGPKRVRIGEKIAFAQVRPPAPFHGTGTYRADPDGTVSWEGSLTVNFPGAPRTPLTGDPFRAQLLAGF